MINRILNVGLGLLFVAGLALTIWGHSALSAMTAPPPVPSSPKRIVTLAPSVTETIFALGWGDRVVGVTQFCHYPPEAISLPKVAGFSDVNFEAILRARPDLVILPVDKIANRRELERLGLSTATLDTRNLNGYMESVLALGQSTTRLLEARSITDRLKNAITKAASRAVGRNRPRVLFSVMHSYEGLGFITEITAVGRDGFFSQMLEIAGGQNVYQGSLSFPKLSREAIITLNPDIIVDLLQGPQDVPTALSDWQGLGSGVEAIKNGRIYLFTDESDTVPGPRIYLTIVKLSESFFPENTVSSPGEKSGQPAASPGQLELLEQSNQLDKPNPLEHHVPPIIGPPAASEQTHA
ncbi:MAG: helical backbone metal receptor [Deltaproteobacteria bacterium]|nr:helical backbone metal receptor [Deltaproteobacteria bacterium]